MTDTQTTPGPETTPGNESTARRGSTSMKPIASSSCTSICRAWPSTTSTSASRTASSTSAARSAKARRAPRWPASSRRLLYWSFRLHEQLSTTEIEAEFKNGVLTVRLPKQEKHLPRQVTVKAS